MNSQFARVTFVAGRRTSLRFLCFAVLTALLSSVFVSNLSADPALTVTTIAGAAGQRAYVDGAPGVARLSLVRGVAADNAGNVYFTEPVLSVVRKVAPDGTVSTLAGGTRGMLDGTGASARFDGLWSIATDAAGNVYVGDSTGSAVALRKITPAGVVTTLAGGGLSGSADGTGRAASFSSPQGIVVDAAGNIYAADSGLNNTIRKITPPGVVTTIAGVPGYPGSDVDGTGSSARFLAPAAIALDNSGNLFVSETSGKIRKVTPAGVVTTVGDLSGGPLSSATGMVATPTGDLYLVNQTNSAVYLFSAGALSLVAGQNGMNAFADGTGSAARFNQPFSITAGSAGNYYIADTVNFVIRKATSSSVTPLAAPVISSVLTATGTYGSSFNYTITASNAPTSFDATGLPTGLAINTTTGIISGTPTQVGNSTVGLSAKNATGTGTANLSLTVSTATATIALSNLSQTFDGSAKSVTVATTPSGLTTTLTYGGSATAPSAAGSYNVVATIANANYTGSASGTLVITASTSIASVTLGNLLQTFDGAPKSVSVATSPSGLATTVTYNGSATAPSAIGSYNVVATVSDPSFTGSSTGTLVISSATVAAPTITQQPASQIASVGDTVTFSVAATGGSPLSYQWSFNGVPIVGATGSSYLIASVATADFGGYSVRVANPGGSVSSAPANLTLQVGQRIFNISVRGTAGIGENVLILGFIQNGGPKTLLLRTAGPTLANFGVAGTLPNPQLGFYGSAGLLASNTGWGTAGNAAEIAGATASLRVFPFPIGSADCAILATTVPGAYTVVTGSAGSNAGAVLTECYDASNTSAHFSNFSGRGRVGIGDQVLIGGFIITGNSPYKVLIRAVGPTLNNYGITGAIADPQLHVFQGSSMIAQNDNWGNDAVVADAVRRSGAFALPATSKDAALVATLQPGAYTIVVSGVGNTTGVALVEVYEIP